MLSYIKWRCCPFIAVLLVVSSCTRSTLSAANNARAAGSRNLLSEVKLAPTAASASIQSADFRNKEDGAALSAEDTLGCPQLQFMYLGTELDGQVQHESLGEEKFIDKPTTSNTQTLSVEFVLEETLFRGVRLDIFELRMPRDLQRQDLKSIATLDDTAVLRRMGFDALFPNKGRIESMIELPSSVILAPDVGSGEGGNKSVEEGDVSLLYYNVYEIALMPSVNYFKVACREGVDGSYQLVQQLLEAGGFTGELLRNGKSSWVVSVRGMLYFQALPSDRGTVQFSDFSAEPGELTIDNMPPSAVVETNSTKFKNPSYSFVANVTQLPEGGLKPIELDWGDDDYEDNLQWSRNDTLVADEENDPELNDLESIKADIAADAPSLSKRLEQQQEKQQQQQPQQPQEREANFADVDDGNAIEGGGDAKSRGSAAEQGRDMGSTNDTSADAAPAPSSNSSGKSTEDSPTAAMAVGFSLAGAAVVVMLAIVLYWQFGGRRVRIKDENEDTVYKSVT